MADTNEAAAALQNQNQNKDGKPVVPVIKFQIEFYLKTKASERERDIREPVGPMICNPFFPGESYRSRLDLTRMTSGMQMTISENGVQGMPNEVPGEIMAIDSTAKLEKHKDIPNTFGSGPVMLKDGLSISANANILDHLNMAWKETFGQEIKVNPMKVYHFNESQFKTMVFFCLRAVEANYAVLIPNSGKIPTRSEVDSLPGGYLFGRGKMAGHVKIEDAANAAQGLLI